MRSPYWNVVTSLIVFCLAAIVAVHGGSSPVFVHNNKATKYVRRASQTRRPAQSFLPNPKPATGCPQGCQCISADLSQGDAAGLLVQCAHTNFVDIGTVLLHVTASYPTSEITWLVLYNNTFAQSTLRPSSFYDTGVTASLRYLAIEASNIDDIEPLTFSRLSALRTLSLRSLKLKSLRPGALAGLRLEVLDLSGNNFASIERHFFDSMTVERLAINYANLSIVTAERIGPVIKHLRTIEMEGNRLRSIHSGLEHYISHMEYVKLGHNPWNCGPALLWLKKLYDLHPELFRQEAHEDLYCSSPAKLSGQTFKDITEEAWSGIKKTTTSTSTTTTTTTSISTSTMPSTSTSTSTTSTTSTSTSTSPSTSSSTSTITTPLTNTTTSVKSTTTLTDRQTNLPSSSEAIVLATRTLKPKAMPQTTVRPSTRRIGPFEYQATTRKTIFAPIVPTTIALPVTTSSSTSSSSTSPSSTQMTVRTKSDMEASTAAINPITIILNINSSQYSGRHKAPQRGKVAVTTTSTSTIKATDWILVNEGIDTSEEYETTSPPVFIVATSTPQPDLWSPYYIGILVVPITAVIICLCLLVGVALFCVIRATLRYRAASTILVDNRIPGQSATCIDSKHFHSDDVSYHRCMLHSGMSNAPEQYEPFISNSTSSSSSSASSSSAVGSKKRLSTVFVRNRETRGTFSHRLGSRLRQLLLRVAQRTESDRTTFEVVMPGSTPEVANSRSANNSTGSFSHNFNC